MAGALGGRAGFAGHRIGSWRFVAECRLSPIALRGGGIGRYGSGAA